ncbi:alpha/beta fold hydrolase [uncultured Serinicoccus sp.]|uniref:alpha/beta fold hydrolase n=1 Tax=uncultured Serinicoccus sp. TaxID=735514 RepID=UPI0026226FD4|nr:alpha/beta hydrolase [uncultured Serinicoccus sp.]
MILTINDADLDVELLGGDDPTKPLLIAHHGAPGLGSRAEPELAFGPLSDLFRVLVFDARGSGKSSDTPPYTHEQWVADVDALREWAGAETFVMAGGSYGGFISMEYAVRHPQRLRALVLRDTSADHEHNDLAIANARASDRVDIDEDRLMRMMEGRIRDDADFRESWRELLPLYDYEYDPAQLDARVASVDYHFATHNAAFSENLHHYDLKPRLGEITCPTLVTVGRTDWITPVSCSETIADLIPEAQLVVFEKSGHSPPREEPELFQRTVRDFLVQHALG